MLYDPFQIRIILAKNGFERWIVRQATGRIWFLTNQTSNPDSNLGAIEESWEIKSCSIKEISRILGEPEEGLGMEIKKLQKNQFVLMSPQRVNETILRIFEILPQGAEAVDRTETEGFEKTDLDKSNQGIEISSIIYDIQKEVQDSQMKSAQKEAVARKLAELRDKLATGSL